MLKIRIISLSILLLLVGVNMHAIAGSDSEALVQKATDKEKSDKESQEREPEETITKLDFFGAFSLVNTQLQWRDFPIGLNDDEATDAVSSVNPKELPFEEIGTFSIEDNEQIAPTSTIITPRVDVVPVSSYRTLNGTTHFIYSQNTQRSSTIAYILNCGTYPLSC